MDKALVVTLSNIGDLVMTTPLMESISRVMPDKSIDIIGDSRSSDLLRNAPYVSKIFHRYKQANLVQQFNLLKHLRTQRYDLVVDLRTGFLPYLLRAQHKYVKKKIRFDGNHSVEENYSCIRYLGKFAFDIPECKIHLAKQDLKNTDTITKNLPPGKWLVVAPGANWPGKKWPADRFGLIIVEALKLGVFDAAMIVGNDNDLEENLRSDFSNLPVLDLRGKTSLNQVAAVLSRASFFIGNDSGLGHIASAVGVDTLTLFGPGQPQRYRPWGRRADVIIAPDENLHKLSWQAVLERVTSRSLI